MPSGAEGVERQPAARTPHFGDINTVTGSACHAGSATKPPALNPPAFYLAINEAGSTVVDIDGLKLDVVFLNDKGEKRDWFTIVKE